MPSPCGGDSDEMHSVALARLGDDEAFSQLYDTHHRRVFALLLRLERDEMAAAEALQETFIQAWKGIRAFRGASGFGTWVHKIAVRTHLMRARRRAREAVRIEGGAAFDAAMYLVAARRAMPETSIDIERALARLPDGARHAAILCLVTGYSYADAAAILGVRIGTVKSRISRARTMLREMLDR
ncbi:MAG TPA: RNA polymerase sigma factor [Gemmatimonadaceae bacterium]|nr:RNA polymerase sigma factor [Gemmatimonadaceae bacterium]